MNTTPDRTFTPFPNVMIPVVEGSQPLSALALAREMGGRTSLLGLVCVSEQASLSAGTGAARRLRREMEQLRSSSGLIGPNRVFVSHTAWDDLERALQRDPPDLLILEYPNHFSCLGVDMARVFANPVCNIAVLRGDWPTGMRQVLIPLRGGPYAELALRLALALEDRTINALHLISPDTTPASEAPFRGLARILPNFPEINYLSAQAADPASVILENASASDLLIMGAAIQTHAGAPPLGKVTERIFHEAACPVLVVKTLQPSPAAWTGPEGERAGAGAISILVDKWFAENTYHASEFDQLGHLVDLKRRQGLTISLALPALNEHETVGEVIECIQTALMKDVPLLDEIVLIDSNSSDATREIAASYGVPVYIHQNLLPDLGGRIGKGDALWKSLLVTHGDIVIWIDTDIVNIHPRFVYGVIGPLLADPQIQFVKGFYQRPLRTGEVIQSSAGGRVTELTARPLINMFFPELSGVIQPLSGEYGGRRSALERLPFFTGYGVESGLLIDVFEKYGLNAIAQVDLLERVHHNQSLEALSKMSFTILQAFIRKLEKRLGGPLLEEVNKSMKLIRYEDGNYFLDVQEVVERERPPMIDIPEYRQRVTDARVGGGA